jgi:RNA polymerase sigma-70 factor (ECF subfamily)
VHSFELLYHRYIRKLYSFSFNYLKIKEEAEEIVQIVFLNLWEHRKTLDDTLSIKSYLYKSTTNAVYNQLKRNAIRNKWAEQKLQIPEPVSNETFEQIYYHDLEQTIDQIIAKLPPQQRKIYILSRIEGLSYEEISKQLDLSVRTVENQMYRALKVIKEQLTTDIYF